MDCSLVLVKQSCLNILINNRHTDKVQGFQIFVQSLLQTFRSANENMNEKKNFCENVLFFAKNFVKFGRKFHAIRSKLSRNSLEIFAKFVRNFRGIRSKFFLMKNGKISILIERKFCGDEKFLRNASKFGKTLNKN